MASESATQEAILRNARAHERERLRNLARSRWPGLDDDALEGRVRELEVEKLREAGRLGRAAQQHLTRVGRRWNSVRPQVEDHLKAVQRLIDSIDDGDERDAA